MKKIALAALLCCLSAGLTACFSLQPEQEPEPVNSSVADVETEEQESVESSEDETLELPAILSLSRIFDKKYEWSEDVCILYSAYSNITLWENGEQYGELDSTLSELKNMQTRTMEEERDTMLSFTNEMMDIHSESFETQVSILDMQVRRADSVAVSFLSATYEDYGFIEDFKGMWGTTYDTRTGEALMLSDVITDMNAVPAIVVQELNKHIWAGDDYSEAVVEEYFKNTPEDSISWTLDYNGVTFYFGDGDLNEPGDGRLTATVSFAEHPELFDAKYTVVPESYMVRLPLDHSFFTDLNGDGGLEEVNCSGYYNSDADSFTKFGIYTDTNGSYHYEDITADGFQPYYVKTGDENHYLYVFCEDSESLQMKLVVYNLNEGAVSRVGEMNVSPAYIPSDTYVLPLDPKQMLLDNFDSMAQDAEYYEVGPDGMPVKK